MHDRCSILSAILRFRLFPLEIDKNGVRGPFHDINSIPVWFFLFSDGSSVRNSPKGE